MSEAAARIVELYRRDQEFGPRPVTRADELPLKYECITDQWLTAVLCAGVPGAAVTAHTLGPVDNGSSNRRKIAVTYNAAGNAAGLPDKLFCKAAHELLNRTLLGLSGAAEHETAFFKYIRPYLDIEAPEGVFCTYDPESFNALSILKDISDSVLEFCDHKTVMDRKRAESQMRLLASFHAAGYTNEKVRDAFKYYLPWPKYIDRQRPYGLKEGSQAGFQDGKDVIPARLFARGAEIWPATEKSIAMQNSMSLTFTHGDVHLKNWYVAGNGEMGLGDWQCCNIGHWSRDFGYTISTALTVEDRRAWERDLLRYYLDELADRGGPKVDFEEGWLRYRQQLITALTWWTITLHPSEMMPDMQPLDSTVEFVRRIAIAMDDLDTLDALKD